MILPGKKNVYENIVAEYRHLIEMGVIRAGEKLPSVRTVAMELGVNPNTVEKAWVDLEQMGFVEIVPKKGAFVRPLAEVDRLNKIKERIRIFAASNIPKEEVLRAVEQVYEEMKEGK